MKEIIKLHDLLGSEIRSRSNAEILREKIAEHSGSIIDLSDVSFISRSFADELCILVEKHIIQLRNASGVVQNMLLLFLKVGRKKELERLMIPK